MRVVPIESLADPQVADYRSVRDADLRGRDLFVVEGRLGVRQLIESSRFHPRSVFVTPAALEGVRDALERLGDEQPVYLAEQAVLNDVVGFNLHRGCLSVVKRESDVRVEDLVRKGDAPSLLVVLEQLTDSDNVGSVFRNAEAFGALGVVVCPRCCDPLYRKSIRVSMGGALSVPFARSEDWSADLEGIRAAGYLLVALHPGAGAIELDAFEKRVRAEGGHRIALLLGSEGPGLSELALRAADESVRIGMVQGVDSLNVGTASGIALHALTGRLRGPSSSPGSAVAEV